MADLSHFPGALVRQMRDASGDDVQLVPLPLAAVLSLRARDDGLERAAQALRLTTLPTANGVAAAAFGDCLWVRPDEWLIIGALADRDDAMRVLSSAVGRSDGAVVDISASRVMLELSGPRARDVLASCCPLDLEPGAFDAGRCAQSVIGKAPALLQLMDDAPRWRIVARPSLAAYIVSWLTDAMLGA